MRRLTLIICVAMFGIAACSTQSATETLPDPMQLLHEATDNVLGVETLRMTVERTGMDYALKTDLGSATFDRMEAQYQSPDTLQARAKVTLAGLPVEIEIFAKDEDQWWRLAGTDWQNLIFLPGFNPRSLLQDKDRGLRAAFGALKNVQIAGETQLEDGSTAYHLTATADGAEISWLMVYLVEITGSTTIDAYIDKTNRLPVKLAVTEPDTAADPAGARVWTMEFYDFNAVTSLTPPPPVPTVESTPIS
ncbi:MAG: LppX_LprAFG lipoprotein [Anaerolineae bacterium]